MIHHDEKLELLLPPPVQQQPPRRTVLLAEDAAFMGLSPRGGSQGGLVHAWFDPPTPGPRPPTFPG